MQLGYARLVNAQDLTYLFHAQFPLVVQLDHIAVAVRQMGNCLRQPVAYFLSLVQSFGTRVSIAAAVAPSFEFRQSL
jgi:hypothetical protein